MIESELAIDGGNPVRQSLLPYGRHHVTDDDVAAVESVLRSDWLTTGPKVAELERALADVTGNSHAVVVSSGTAALHAMMAGIGIGPGDEVIVPAITFAATANAVAYCGGTPVFADVDPRSLLIDPRSVADAITSNTRAVIAVDFAGQAADYSSLADIVKGTNIHLMADACHALGGSQGGAQIGTLAEASIFSFHPVKHVAGGEGGAIVTNDDALAERMRIFRNHGITTDHTQRAAQGTWTYDMVTLGFNYRMSDIQCALTLSQLSRLNAGVGRRREIAAAYDSAFASIDTVIPLETSTDNSHAYHLYVIRLDLSRLTVDRAQVFAALRAENIGVNVHYAPVPWHSYYRERGYEPGSWPGAESTYEEILSLPMFPTMTDDDTQDVVNAVNKVVTAYKT